MNKILIVDDDKSLVEMLQKYFLLKGYSVYTAFSGMEAIEKVSLTPDLILLDINLPEFDGLEVCKRIRNDITCPILFLTARAEEQDRVNGLIMGGDDYIVKPFSLKELEARIIAHLKREERFRNNHKIIFKDRLQLDFINHSIKYDDKEIEFTKREYDIIEFLVLHAGQTFDREHIYESVWGIDGDGDSKTITELIRRIRQKLAIYTEQEFIQTVWGCGYKWVK